MLIKALTPHVSSRTRAKGVDYFRSGGVIEIAGGEWTAHAVVRGTRDYRVDLLRESGTDRVTASCECPYYADRAEICKHIWAALLEAEQRGLLAGDGLVLPGAVLEPEYRPLPGFGRQSAALLIPGAKPGKPPAWERFLRNCRRMSPPPSARSRRRAFRTARSFTRSMCAKRLPAGARSSTCSFDSGGRMAHGPSRKPSTSPRPRRNNWPTRPIATSCRC